MNKALATFIVVCLGFAGFWWLSEIDGASLMSSVLKITNYDLLLLSVLFLFLGFLFQGFSCSYLFPNCNSIASLKLGVEAQGVTIFSKYIPGKVWVVVGRAGYASGITGSKKTAFLNSLNLQFISLFFGVIISLPILLNPQLNVLDDEFNFPILAMGLVCLLAIGILALWKLSWSSLPSLHAVVCSFFAWTFWGVGFMYFSESLGFNASVYWVAIFSTAATLGIAALVVPGGLGVREGAITALVVAIGESFDQSVQLSIAARFWFFGGEIFIFFLGVCLRSVRVNR